jgi:hypothetical protein
MEGIIVSTSRKVAVVKGTLPWYLSSALAVLVCLTLPASAQQPSRKIDVSRLGPQIGHEVPDFRLQDAQGKVWTRDSIMGPKGAMLVFSRSADW